MCNARAVASGSLIGGASGALAQKVYVRKGSDVVCYSLSGEELGASAFHGDFAPVPDGAVVIANGGLVYETE